MPIYEYICKDCYEEVSILVRSLNSEIDLKCKSCGTSNLDRVISQVAVLHSSQDLHREFDSMAKYRDSTDDGTDPFNGKGDYLADNL